MMRCIFAAAVILSTVFGKAVAAEEKADLDSERAASLAQLIKAMESITISIAPDSAEKLAFNKSPVLRYKDQVISATAPAIRDGTMFVWTKKGRPEAVTAVHTGSLGRLWAEFLSLSPIPLSADRMGQVLWSPNKSGIALKPLENVPTPDDTAEQRLKQMQTLLKSFSAEIKDPQIGWQVLQLLPQPVFRYSQADRGILDGAIFVFARSTNPEMLIVLEAHGVNEKPFWAFSPARFTGRESILHHQGQVIWSREAFVGQRDPAEPFFQTYVVPENE